MKIKELKKMIKSAFIAENSIDDDAALQSEYDFLDEAEEKSLDDILASLMAENLNEDDEGIDESIFDILKKKPSADVFSSSPHNPINFPLPSVDQIEKTISGKKPLELLDILHDVIYEKIKINLKNTSKEQMRTFLKAVFSQEKLGKIEKREVYEYMELLMGLPNFDQAYASELGLAERVEDLSEAEKEETEEDEPSKKAEVDSEELEDKAEEETTDGGEEKSDSIVVDKRIVSLSSLPGETRKILDSLETLRAQAEEFGDQKFITQVGNTITFFTRDFVVAGDEPTKAKVDESLEMLRMKKIAGLLTEGEYAKALLREEEASIADFLNANIEEFKKKVANPRSKFEIMGDEKVATAGPDSESGIDVSFDKTHMLELFPASDPFNKVKETEIAGRKVYYNNYL